MKVDQSTMHFLTLTKLMEVWLLKLRIVKDRLDTVRQEIFGLKIICVKIISVKNICRFKHSQIFKTRIHGICTYVLN